MHKLLERQLKKSVKLTKKDFPEEWSELLKSVDEAYVQHDQYLSMMEHSLEVSSEELNERNEKLSQTLKELQEAQSQLIHSAKMAGLGQLIATIAHEINTPTGAIQSAIEELNSNNRSFLEVYPKVVQSMGDANKDEYNAVIKEILELPTMQVTTREQRQISNELEGILVANEPLKEIADNQNFITQLVLMGYKKDSFIHMVDFLKLACGTELMNLKQDILLTIQHTGSNKNYINNIKIATQRITSMVRALKSYTRSDSSGEPSLVNVTEDVETTITLFGNKLNKQVALNKHFSEVPTIMGYPDQLNQVWTNLIQNAMQALTNNGEINLYIYLHKGPVEFKELRGKAWQKTVCLKSNWDKVESFIMFEVEDNGVGIDPAIVPKLFEPYFTTKPKGIGTGLGLNICQDIVHKHNGKIIVYSKAGAGTCMQVALPVPSN